MRKEVIMSDRDDKRSKERDRRWQRVREFMGKKGLDALVVAIVKNI